MKNFLMILGGLSVAASVFMYYVGNNSGHLSELADLFWLPLPLGAVCFAAATRMKKKEG